MNRKKNKQMKYLVTGGAGFIGSNIVKEILKRGESVRILDNFATGKRENISELTNNPDFELIEGDLRDDSIVKKAVKGVEYILHQGALPSVPRSVKDPITSNNVNILGTLNILEAAKEYGVKRVVCASSSSVYGNSKTLPKIETMPISPLSPYALTKYAQERYCQIFYDIYGLETVSLRYFNVFGPNQDPTSTYSAVIPLFINIMKQDKQPTIHGDGLQSRDFTFVSNNVAANLLACTAPNAAGKVFNIACGDSFTLLELVAGINKLLGKNIEAIHVNDRVGDIKHSMADINKAIDIMGFEVQCTFLKGLEKTVEFFAK